MPPGGPDGIRLQGVARLGQAFSKVTRMPLTPPGPTRPFTSTDVIAFSDQPLEPCSFRTFSSLSPDIFPPIIPSRSSTTLYCGMGDLLPYRCPSTIGRLATRSQMRPSPEG